MWRWKCHASALICCLFFFLFCGFHVLKVPGRCVLCKVLLSCELTAPKTAPALKVLLEETFLLPGFLLSLGLRHHSKLLTLLRAAAKTPQSSSGSTLGFLPWCRALKPKPESLCAAASGRSQHWNQWVLAAPSWAEQQFNPFKNKQTGFIFLGVRAG